MAHAASSISSSPPERDVCKSSSHVTLPIQRILETALDKGFGHKEWLEHDSDLDSIRATPRFQAITQAM